MNSARGDDTKDLKPAILELIPQKYLLGPANESGEKSIWGTISSSAGHSKNTRGFTNNITARLLCPVDHLRAFDTNPAEFVFTIGVGQMLMTQHPKTRTIEKLKNGTLSRVDRDKVPKFPLFMYDEDMVEPGKVTSGLFRGPLLIAARFTPLGLRSPSLTNNAGVQIYLHLEECCKGGGRNSSKKCCPDQPNEES